jgi:hypothetical protein
MQMGHRPFRGASQAELTAAILRDPPPRVTKSDARPSLITLIHQSLAKATGERLQSARLVASALRDISREQRADQGRSEHRQEPAIPERCPPRMSMGTEDLPPGR